MFCWIRKNDPSFLKNSLKKQLSGSILILETKQQQGIGRNMADGLALGFDLGGTKIYAVVTDRENRIISEAKISTPVGATPDEMVKVITDFGKDLLTPLNQDYAGLDGIGAAVPAPVDPITGDCYHAINLGWKNFSMKAAFQQLTGRKVCLGNDGNLGVLAEYTCGAAKGMNTVIGYYVGTGLGGGILLNGKVHTGNSGLAGELGHTVIKKGGRKCGCGQRGCAEAYCSKTAFVKALQKKVFKHGESTCLPCEKFNKDTKNIKSRHLAKAYRAGDPPVRSVIRKGAGMLGIAAASTAAILAPDCIVLGGGVISAMGEEFFPIFKRSFEDHLAGIVSDRIKLCITELGDPAVALGATILARSMKD